MPSTLLIYNPVAGRYPSRMLTERAASVLKKHGWEVDIETTTDGSQISQLAHQAVQDNLDAIIVVGGDGSLNRALPSLVGTDTALGVLPAGTSNVWAQELSLPGLSWTRWMALEESAHRIAHGSIYHVDVGMCDDKYFLLWAGIGLDAFIVHRIEPRRQWEKNFTLMRYGASALWNASQWSGINLRVFNDDQLVHGKFMLAVVSNVRLYAGGLATISPQGKLDDGVMELWLFDGENLEDVLQQAWSLWSGQHVNSARVRCVPFNKIRIESDSQIYFQMDGEPEFGGEQVTIRAVSQGLKVLSPDQAPESLFHNKGRELK